MKKERKEWKNATTKTSLTLTLATTAMVMMEERQQEEGEEVAVVAVTSAGARSMTLSMTSALTRPSDKIRKKGPGREGKEREQGERPERIECTQVNMSFLFFTLAQN